MSIHFQQIPQRRELVAPLIDEITLYVENQASGLVVQ
jgi:hypothetical protein